LVDPLDIREHEMSPQQAALRSLRLVVPPHRAEHQSERDRRVHHRCTLAELPWLREVRLKYGPRAVLIDLSGGGAQLETAGYRLNPGSMVVVEINGNQDESPIPSRVIRCQIAGLAPQPIYRSALQFKRILALPAGAAARQSLGADANPAREHARLLHALRRLDAARSGWDANASPMVGFVGSAAEVEAISGVLATIETPAARRAGPAFTREVAALLNIVARAVEKDTPEDVTVDCLVDRLRRTVPVRAIRLTESLSVSSGDAIYFDVPVRADRPSAKLVVEFPRDFRSEEWQFQYLKTAAHVLALVREIAEKRHAAERAGIGEDAESADQEATAASADDSVSPPSRVVVRYLDGRLLKGYAPHFVPARGAVEIWPSPDAPSTSRVTVPFGQLKAIFFVRDFDGGPSCVSANPSKAKVCGRRVAVTFLDGEELTGATLNYQTAGPGFFVHPLDDRTNNTRVYVLTQSIRHVKFPGIQS
jgi:hypothetical protein